jgi:hypothetical protein
MVANHRTGCSCGCSPWFCSLFEGLNQNKKLIPGASGEKLFISIFLLYSMFETILGIVLAASIFTFSYIAINLDKKQHGALSIMFIILSLFMVMIGLNLASDTAKVMDMNVTMSNNILNQAYTPMNYVVVIVAFYFIIFFIGNTLEIMAQKKEDKEKKGDY